MACAASPAVARTAALTTLSVIVLVSCSIERYGRTPIGPTPIDLGTFVDAAIDVGSPPDARPVIDDAPRLDMTTADAARDAALDLGSSDLGAEDSGPDTGSIEDAGPAPDADTPVCPSGCDCEQSCSAEACDCSGGCPCALSCSGFCSGKCDHGGTICTLDANGVVASTFGCDHGATCEIHVSASTAMTIDCRHASSCDVECNTSVPCTVRCREGSSCVLRCVASVCAITDCPPAMLRDCPGGVQVCNAMCPVP